MYRLVLNGYKIDSYTICGFSEKYKVSVSLFTHGNTHNLCSGSKV